jgi:hypothetical protein
MPDCLDSAELTNKTARVRSMLVAGFDDKRNLLLVPIIVCLLYGIVYALACRWRAVQSRRRRQLPQANAYLENGQCI